MAWSLKPPAAAAARSPLLDCVRAVAILSVFAFHVATRYTPDILDPLAGALLKVGFLGVDIFFPLSGFLITRFLLTSTRSDFVKVFFLRRVFRIVPLYLLALLAYLLASQMFGVAADVIHRLWINALFLTGWFIFIDGKDTVPFLITWSLSVEEFGYILLGLTALIWRRGLVAFLVLACLAALALRYQILISDTRFETFQALYYLPPARLDSIALGGLTAWAMGRGKTGWLLAALLAGGAVMLMLARADILHFRALLFLLVAVGTCLFIIAAETGLRNLRGPVIQIFASIGFYSYFNYLFQFFVIDLYLMVMRKAGQVEPEFWVTFAITLAITHGLAVLSYRIFEGPIMAWGRRLEQSSGDKATRQGAELTEKHQSR